MLCISRKANESVLIGNDVEVVVIEIDRGKVRLGIRAPLEVKLLRNELVSARCGRCNIPLTPRDEYTRAADSAVCAPCAAKGREGGV